MPRKKNDNGNGNGNGKKQKPEPIEAQLIDKDNEVRRIEEETAERALMPFTDNLPYDCTRIKNELKFLTTIHAVSGFEIGKRLVAICENEPHKDFQYILDELNLSRRTALRYMEAARRFINAPKLRKGIKSINKLLALDISDKEIEEAERTGKVLGRPVEQIDRMTIAEIREENKKLKKRNEEAKEQVEQLRKEKAELEQRINDWQEGGSDDQRVNEWINDLEKKMRVVASALSASSPPHSTSSRS